jgi:hypothetical protein
VAAAVPASDVVARVRPSKRPVQANHLPEAHSLDIPGSTMRHCCQLSRRFDFLTHWYSVITLTLFQRESPSAVTHGTVWTCYRVPKPGNTSFAVLDTPPVSSTYRHPTLPTWLGDFVPAEVPIPEGRPQTFIYLRRSVSERCQVFEPPTLDTNVVRNLG